MGTLEIVSAICLILSCIFIIVMVLMQDSKKGMSQTLTGGGGDSFYQKNSGRSKEARLAKATRTAAILFFIVTLVVNVFAIYFRGGASDAPGDSGTGIELPADMDDFDWDAFLADSFEAENGHIHSDDCDHD
ncbi:MAG: preprotein translocase subunit SecG [Oscillospiraceae bacterium]|nr:preprotein translocase subunit SecG [Oscillospiraceae bacterium]